MNTKFQIEINEKFGKEFKETQELGLNKTSVELSDEKHDKLCEFFKKFGIEKYTKKEALIEVSDALGIE